MCGLWRSRSLICGNVTGPSIDVHDHVGPRRGCVWTLVGSVASQYSERAKVDPGPALDTGVNLAYAGCESGKGFCAHKHPDWEIFVVLSGTWKITVDEDEVMVGPMDVVAVPGDVYHAAMNAGDARAFMMSINMGSDTARYTIHPSIVAELATIG